LLNMISQAMLLFFIIYVQYDRIQNQFIMHQLVQAKKLESEAQDATVIWSDQHTSWRKVRV